MFTSFQEKPNTTHSLLKDFLRLVRDIIAIINDFLELNALTNIVEDLNNIIGDEQNTNKLFANSI